MPDYPLGLGPKWEELKQNLWPNEDQGVDSDCPNPHCDYMLTDQDMYDAEEFGGHFTCPNCRWTYDLSPYMYQEVRQQTRAGMTPKEMGQLGESVVRDFADENNGIPGLGELRWEAPDYNDPIDAVVGDFAIEIKSLHSESYPRFKIAADPTTGGNRSDVIKQKIDRMNELGMHLGSQLAPGVLGVRLNFFTSRADFFFSSGFKDARMTAMEHLGTSDFSKLNPFKKPEEVSALSLPTQGETYGDEDIPF